MGKKEQENDGLRNTDIMLLLTNCFIQGFLKALSI